MAPDTKRLDIQEFLEELVEGIHVYFQPPENLKIEYPCIIYKRDDLNTDYADNYPYRNHKRYSVTVVDSDPDSPIPNLIAALPMSTFNRFYTADNLNHDVFNVFF